MKFVSSDAVVEFERKHRTCSVCQTLRWIEIKKFQWLRKLLGRETKTYHGCTKVPIFCEKCKGVTHFGCSCDTHSNKGSVQK